MLAYSSGTTALQKKVGKATVSFSRFMVEQVSSFDNFSSDPPQSLAVPTGRRLAWGFFLSRNLVWNGYPPCLEPAGISSCLSGPWWPAWNLDKPSSFSFHLKLWLVPPCQKEKLQAVLADLLGSQHILVIGVNQQWNVHASFPEINKFHRHALMYCFCSQQKHECK